MIRFRTKLYFGLAGASAMLSVLAAAAHSSYMLLFAIVFTAFYLHMANMYLEEDALEILKLLQKERE